MLGLQNQTIKKGWNDSNCQDLTYEDYVARAIKELWKEKGSRAVQQQVGKADLIEYGGNQNDVR